MNFGIIDFSSLENSWIELISLILLLCSWLFFCLYGILIKKLSYLLLGIGIFFLFIKEWLIILFNYTHLDFSIVLFWDTFFLFAFFWIIKQIYHECIIGENDYFFPNSSPTQNTARPFLDIVFPSTNILTPFTVVGGALFITIFSILMSYNTSDFIRGIIAFGFFTVITLNIEKRFQYWLKDYAYMGTPWTQPEVIRPFKFFYIILSLGYLFIMLVSISHYFKVIDLAKNTDQTLLLLFTVIKAIALLSLYWFFYRLLTYDYRTMLVLQRECETNREWIEKTFTTEDKSIITYQRLQEKYPQLLFYKSYETLTLTLIQYLAEILKKFNCEWVYLHEPDYPHPEKRLVVFNPAKAKEKQHFSQDDFKKLNINSYLPEIETLTKVMSSVFLYEIKNHSLSFQRELSNLFSASSLPKFDSLIAHPFPFKNKICLLLLVNPKLNTSITHPLQKDIISNFTHRFSQVNFTKGAEIKSSSQMSTPEKETAPPPLELIEKQGIYDTQDATSFISHHPEKKSELLIKPLPSSESLFPYTKKKNKFILNTKIKNTYITNNARIIKSFPPANNRKVDKISYKIAELYPNQIQKTLCMVSNIGRKGKLFVFNQFDTNNSLLAANNLNLLNLFYTYLPRKRVDVFVNKWQQGWKPFSRKGTCQFLAMEFHPEDHQLNYYNVGINYAYYYSAEHDIFTPFYLNQPHIYPKKQHVSLANISQLQIHPHDLIIIFSKELMKIKNKTGKIIDIKELFNEIRRNRSGEPGKILLSIEEYITKFAYSLVESTQLIFIGKILKQVL